MTFLNDVILVWKEELQQVGRNPLDKPFYNRLLRLYFWAGSAMALFVETCVLVILLVHCVLDALDSSWIPLFGKLYLMDGVILCGVYKLRYPYAIDSLLSPALLVGEGIMVCATNVYLHLSFMLAVVMAWPAFLFLFWVFKMWDPEFHVRDVERGVCQKTPLLEDAGEKVEDREYAHDTCPQLTDVGEKVEDDAQDAPPQLTDVGVEVEHREYAHDTSPQLIDMDEKVDGRDGTYDTTPQPLDAGEEMEHKDDAHHTCNHANSQPLGAIGLDWMTHAKMIMELVDTFTEQDWEFYYWERDQAQKYSPNDVMTLSNEEVDAIITGKWGHGDLLDEYQNWSARCLRVRLPHLYEAYHPVDDADRVDERDYSDGGRDFDGEETDPLHADDHFSEGDYNWDF